MDASFNRALAIKELQELVGFSQTQMLEFLAPPTYKEMLYRSASKVEREMNKRPTVAANLKLKPAESIEDSFDLEKHSLDLEYAYHKIFQKPCDNMNTVEIFLKLFQEAINLKYNDIYDEEYIQSIRERR